MLPPSLSHDLACVSAESRPVKRLNPVFGVIPSLLRKPADA